MFNTILFPTDGSPLSDKAAETALAFAQLNKAKLVAISVVQPFPFSPMADGGVVLDAGLYEEQMHTAAQQAVDKLGQAAQAAGLAFEGVVAISPSPYEEIVNAAANYHCDIILMASHGRKGLNKLFVGSETQKVLGHTQLPVLVLR
ncbi:universal stress protein [Janthinobacterium sp.]|uniref:universal stress protein n=1 Tax=Janthinobacterium sp. TaxID=1871054 RepID=UPI002618EA65|nr:universal stress protein [Janthinobacterium sp.]